MEGSTGPDSTKSHTGWDHNMKELYPEIANNYVCMSVCAHMCIGVNIKCIYL